MLVPFACVQSAINWACISVGKPGYSVVSISAGKIFSAGSIVIVSSVSSIPKPICMSFRVIACICFGLVSVKVIFEFVIAPAHK